MKRWYVIQVYAGYEEAIKVDLDKDIQGKEVRDYFGDILIPSAKSRPLFDVQAGKEEQLFPGYMLIEMEMVPEAMRLVVSHPRTLRFLGGKEPIPLSKKEVDRVLAQVRGEVALAPEKSEFEVGGEVDIQDGPFTGFVGIVDNIDEENERLKVMVSIFGRMTPVELGFSQVKR